MFCMAVMWNVLKKKEKVNVCMMAKLLSFIRLYFSWIVCIFCKRHCKNRWSGKISRLANFFTYFWLLSNQKLTNTFDHSLTVMGTAKIPVFILLIILHQVYITKVRKKLNHRALTAQCSCWTYITYPTYPIYELSDRTSTYTHVRECKSM